MSAALYVLHYIHSTIDYSFTFTSELKLRSTRICQFPTYQIQEAYDNALPPKLGNHHHLTTYSDACWGSQVGNAIQEGIQLPLFKFCSMSSAIFFDQVVCSLGKQNNRIVLC
jgi:hypothetical protein